MFPVDIVKDFKKNIRFIFVRNNDIRWKVERSRYFWVLSKLIW